VRFDTVDVLTVTTALKRQGRDVMAFLKESREAHKNTLPASSLSNSATEISKRSKGRAG
jgi:hypothetical protein